MRPRLTIKRPGAYAKPRFIVYDADARGSMARALGKQASDINSETVGVLLARGFGDTVAEARSLGADKLTEIITGNHSATASFKSKTTIDMGGAVRRKPKKQRKEPGRKQWPGPTDFYFVAFYDEHDNNKVFRVSPGICATGDDRYLTLAKFFGLSVKALAPSILFPTRKAAERHEAAAIAKMDKDPAWEKTGKETYKPVKEMTV